MLKLTRSRLLRRVAPGIIALFVVAACGGNNTAGGGGDNTLTVATEPAFPPFESQAAGGELEGFDIDLFRAIGEEAGKEIEFESLPFDGIIPALQSGQVDAAISAMTITPEREATIDFSRPYFRAGLAIAVRDETQNINSLDDLKNKKIAVQIGTTGAEQAKSIEGTKISTFDSAPLALQELANGNVDAVINDAPVTLYAIESGNLEGLKVVGELVTEEYYGIATPSGSENREVINNALNSLIESGRYAEIYQKWFGEQPPELPETAPAQ